MAIPKRVADRMNSGLKRLLPILNQQRSRDVSEADTVTLVKDLLSEVFGYDKYSELTSEVAIRGTYCDLAIRVDDKMTQLVEVKAIGIALDDRHVKQAIDYASNQGIEWVILTNAVIWRLYQVIFAKPIDKRLLIEIDIASIDPRKEDQLEAMHLFSKEGFAKGAHIDLRDRQDASSRYMLAALLVSNENVISAIRRELRRVVDVLVDDAVIVKVLHDEVIKRDAMEGPAAEAAAKRVSRREDRALRAASKPKSNGETDEPPAPKSSGEVPASPADGAHR